MQIARDFFQDIFSAISELRPKFLIHKDDRSIEMLSTDILKSDDETSIQRLGSLILGKYQMLDDDAKHRFFTFLADEMDINIDGLEASLKNYRNARNASHLSAVMTSAAPKRQDLLGRLNQIPGATQVLVEMRADLLRFARKDDHLKTADLDFAHLFTSWFNRGFLTLKPISWQTPANILAKIIKYEAVHAINDWDDLRRRLQPKDRRCFAFFHPAMPEEPLVFVEVALSKGVPNSIQTVLGIRDDADIDDGFDTAAFYSISNCQRGLQGISFGNSLIKQVVADLAKEIPSLVNFVTLSPLPGFAAWLKSGQDHMPQAELGLIFDAGQHALKSGDHDALSRYDTTLKALAAIYLTQAKRPDGQPLDAVARFHLRNGASIDALHARADISNNGLEQAYGVMVNYRYDLPNVAMRHENYIKEFNIEASKHVMQLAATKPSDYYLQSET